LLKLGEIQLTAVERGHEIKDGGTDQAEHRVAEVKSATAALFVGVLDPVGVDLLFADLF